jgi:hypothetical protein
MQYHAGRDSVILSQEIKMNARRLFSIASLVACLPLAACGSSAVADTSVSFEDGLLPAGDGPWSTFDQGAPLDGPYFTFSDGRVLVEVAYCPPIQPLPKDPGTDRYSCPLSFDDAVAIANSGIDSGIPFEPWAVPTVQRCYEGAFVYYPAAGQGTSCFYDPETRQLVAIYVSGDTFVICDQGATASYVHSIYGSVVPCTKTIDIAVDAGTRG